MEINKSQEISTVILFSPSKPRSNPGMFSNSLFTAVARIGRKNEKRQPPDSGESERILAFYGQSEICKFTVLREKNSVNTWVGSNAQMRMIEKTGFLFRAIVPGTTPS